MRYYVCGFKLVNKLDLGRIALKNQYYILKVVSVLSKGEMVLITFVTSLNLSDG